MSWYIENILGPVFIQKLMVCITYISKTIIQWLYNDF